MRLEQLAINTVSLRAQDLESLLDACAAGGFRQVEFALGQVKPWLASHSVSELRSLLEARGLRCIGGFEATALCFADAEAKAANHDLLRRNAELFDALGGGVMVVGTDGPAQRSPDDLATVGATLRGLAESIPESVALALEFNWSPLVRSLRSAALAVAAADHPRVGILFDPAHYHCTPSKLEDLTAAVAQRVLHVHVDDMRDLPGDLSNCNADRVLPGQGCLDLAALFGRIEAAGYGGYFSIEMFSEELWALPPAEAARRMYDSLMALTA